MSLLDHLPHTCSAFVRTRTKDALGGGKDSYASMFSGRACWLQPASSNEIVEYQKRSINVTNKVYFVEDPEIDNKYVLTIGANSYKVQSMASPDASAGLGVVYRVMVELFGGDVPL